MRRDRDPDRSTRVGRLRGGSSNVMQILVGEDLRLLEQLEAGLVVVNPTGTVVLWNAAATRILGLKADDALGTPWADCLTLVRDGASGGANLRADAAHESGWHGPVQVRVRGGTMTWLRAHVQPISLPEFGGGTGIAALFWAAGEPDRSGDGSETAPLPYRDLFLSSPEALFLANLNSIVVDANEAAGALVQAKPADLIGKRLVDFFVGWSETDAESARAELTASGSIVRQIRVKPVSGESFEAEMITSLAAPVAGGYALIRLRDTTQERRLERMLGDLAILARPGDEPLSVEDVAKRAMEMVAKAWGAGASLALLDGPDGFSIAAGSNASEAIRATISALDPAQSPLALLVGGADAPFEMDLDAGNAPPWTDRARALGLRILRATPLWFDDRRIGAMVLLWSGGPPLPFDTARLEHIGRHVALAIGGAEMRRNMRREAELRESLEGSTRLGGVVVAQMADSIVTSDPDGRITVVNPAGERLYGFAEEEARGRRLDEVIEQLRLDGTPIGAEVVAEAGAMGYWHGRVVHRPLIGNHAGRHLAIDLSLTAIRDDQQQPAGFIAVSREVTASAHLEPEAAALSSLALATGRARSRREAAESAMERLCEATMADIGIIVSWEDKGVHTIEASRGIGQELLATIRDADIPALNSALQELGAIIAFESFGGFVDGRELAAALAKEGLVTGFIVDLRGRDQSIGFLALGSRHPAWVRPGNEVIHQAAAQIVSALENARLMERLEQGLEQERRLTAQLETLMGLTLLPQGEIDESTMAWFLLERVVDALGADGGLVVRASADRLRVVASHRIPANMIEAMATRPFGEFNFWRRLTEPEGTGAFYQSLRDLVDEGGEVEAMMARSVSSYAVFPIRDGADVIGAFLCYFSASSEATATADSRTIDAVGRIISIAYANVRMSEGLNEAAEHERRLTAELRVLQELTLLGASTDDLGRLARETIEAVVVATGAAGGGYILVDPSTARVDPIVWVGQSSRSWAAMSESPTMPADWPPIDRLQSDEGIWLARSDKADDASSGSDDDSPACAQAVLPLRVDERLAGVLHLEWSAMPRVEQFDNHFLEPIARICSISLANFRLRSELLHRAAAQRALGHRLDTLDELTRIGEEASSFEELAHRTVSLVREALGASGVCYLLIEPGHHFETHAVAGETGAFRLWLKGVPAKEIPGGSVLLSGGGSVLRDFIAGQVNERVLPLARATGFKSFGAIPIRTGEELAGALLCFFEQSCATLPVDEAALDSVARIVGIALANFRLRERLVSSEERYRTLFEESPDALFVSALDGTVLDANEAAVRLYHVSRGEVLGRYFGHLISADEREMARRRQIVWAQGRGTFEDRGRRSDGSEFPVEVEVRVVELGGQRRFLSLVRDLSDQERLTNELLQAQKMEAIGQLVSGVAHELNNPLAAIVAFSQLMRGDARLPEDMKHDAGLLVQEADRTRRIVQNLLDFARQRPPERRQTSIATLVRSVLELQSYALNANRIQVVLDIPDTLPEVDLDRAQLQQVLLNLTINAIQAIRTRDHATQPHLWVSAAIPKKGPGRGGPKTEKHADDQQRVRITIRDDGPGVPESARTRIFDPFFTTKQPGEGTGLGLSVSFGIVAAHGGQLWYEPGPRNVGSCFLIELPVRAKPTDGRQPTALLEAAPRQEAPPQVPAKDAPAAATATARPAKRSRRGAASKAPAAAPAPASPAGEPARRSTDQPRILALDDEPSIRAFLKKALAAAGMECLPFQDGAQALDGLRDIIFDVMLIDHRMAGMSGTEFYEAAIEFRPELAKRAVFMSGDVLNPDLRGFATQRGIRLLAKPFDIDTVVRVVREVLVAANEADRQSR
jgi:PAS domain S-box-containing protein